jgi:hypothetical protein
MTSRWPRYLAALAAFIVIAAGGVLLFGEIDPGAADPDTFAFQATANVLALVLAIALLLALVVYGIVEYLQTGSLSSIGRQFGTRTIVLIPLAIAINIILGQTVATALRVPIYLDSIGTILVGALAGPIAGAVTGFTANILWSYVIPPPFQYPPAAAFAIVAAVIGLLAGVFARGGFLRPRPNRPAGQLAAGGILAAALIVVLGFLAYQGYVALIGPADLTPEAPNAVFVVLGWLALGLVVLTVLGLAALLIVRRDLTAAYVVVAGVVTGVVAALISAPIAAGVFGGVTGAGVDFLVAAFRQGGADIFAATLGQGLISDPIDKITTFFVVYLILSAMARRMKARFPQGELLLEETDQSVPEEGEWRGAPA